MAQSKKFHITHPLSVQLITIISFLVIIVLGTTTFLVTYFVRNDTRINAEENNFTVNRRTASETQNKLDSIKANAFLLLDMISNESVRNDLSDSQLKNGGKSAVSFFKRCDDIAFVLVSDILTIINEDFFKINKIEKEKASDVSKLNTEANKLDNIGIVNIASIFNRPMLALFLDITINGKKEPMIIGFSTESLSDSYGTGTLNTSVMASFSGNLLLSADIESLKSNVKIDQNPAIREMASSESDNKQLLYTGFDGQKYFGAFTRLSGYNAGILTTVPEAIVFSAVQSSMWRNIYLSVAVLALAILFIWFWSKKISIPIKQLAESALEIGEGNYGLDFQSIKARKNSELGVLTDSFGKMSSGLAERERLKDAFGKFSNKAIAEKAARGELKLGGETKEVTVFFSDIRSFTAMSEKLTPHEVVLFLNDYMTRMVECVNKTNGVVDKYIGDSIMAVWGSPFSGGSTAIDAFNGVKCACMMRAALIDMNKERKRKGLPVVKIGCGINSGPVVSGQIGSNERIGVHCYW